MASSPSILIIGAGIAGLSAAAALHQSLPNSTITILEKSQFSTEVGAALAISPNGSRALDSLGFDFERARALKMNFWEGRSGVDVSKQLSCMDLSDAEEKYGAAGGKRVKNANLWSVHRVDLHRELWRLVSGDSASGQEGASAKLEKGIEVKLGALVVSVDAVAGSVVLAGGETLSADLIIAADGLHSVARTAVLGREVGKSGEGFGSNAFRFLIPTEKLQGYKFWDWKKQDGVTILADTATTEERHAVIYSCRGGEVQNVVGIHPSKSDSKQDLTEAQLKDLLLAEYKHFHPDFLEVLKLAEHVKLWPLVAYEPFEKWTNGRVVLIGDAAHPMLPFGGQAANQAIEDAIALGLLMKDTTVDAIPTRLVEFQGVRYNRASTIQMVSLTRINRESEVAEQLKAYKTAENSVPSSFKERVEHAYAYDIAAACQKVIDARA